MDLGAYANIDNLEHVMKNNGIYIPRLRGLRLMKDETPVTREEIDEQAHSIGVYRCKGLCQSGFVCMNPNTFMFSNKTGRIIKKYMVLDKNKYPTDVNWKAVHGKKRKMFKFALKSARKKVQKGYEHFNKYCGAENVLYIHARIGGKNWDYFGGQEIEKQPWFIEKVDDAFDCTYCDIYARFGGC